MELSRKRVILIVIASCAGILLLAALVWLLFFKAQFSVYHDEQYKFSIKYPKSWKVFIHPKPNVAVAFLRPKDTALDVLQENFNVTVQEVPGQDSSLSAFSATVKKQMQSVFTGSINVVDDKPVHFSWREGHLLAVEAPQPDHLKMINAWVLRGSQAYILTFLGDMNKYNQDALVVDEMIKSLQLL